MFKPQRITELSDELKRKDKQWTYAKIAMENDISLTAFNNIRGGESNPSVLIMERFARFFGVDMNYFFDYSDWKCQQISKEIKNSKKDDQPEYLWKRLEELARENGRLQAQVELYKGMAEDKK